MNYTQILVLFCILLRLPTYAQDLGTPNGLAKGIPLWSVLTNPAEYSGAWVRVYGVLYIDEENLMLAPSLECFEMGDRASALELRIDPAACAGWIGQVKQLHRAYVVVDGLVTVQKDEKGKPFYPLMIDKVSRIGFRGRPVPRDIIVDHLRLDKKLKEDK